ncbi:PaaX family transcriptional regulator C-terminal domain-containing protein [Mycobacteroides abscessus]|uniref:PaaX family transcriptional regulator C-terminal domain-containing protein n=1 Tax=Mycobacteroides abscessus TaxID=36809 RepID=UPI00036C2A3A|nr:PaaX family transcriptional regulator C-terminal domain-containing protein [Mycobacteroides abscessus]
MNSSSLALRKLTARSAILSVLLGAHPAEAPAGWIVQFGAELGIQESAIRVALTRMLAAGDLERRGSTYRLSERLIARQRRQDGALWPNQTEWNGEWRLAVTTVTAHDSTERAALREILQNAKFGELREGVWTRPENLSTKLPQVACRRLTQFTGRPAEPADELAELLFRPRQWAARANELLVALSERTSIPDGFAVAAATVRHILDDPVLPEQLLPEPWPGSELRRVYEGFRSEFTEYAEILLARANGLGAS